MDHFTFDPRLDGIGGRGEGAPTHFSEQGPTFVNPALLLHELLKDDVELH